MQNNPKPLKLYSTGLVGFHFVEARMVSCRYIPAKKTEVFAKETRIL